ncbi:hypothetical protein C1H46_023646 [Malus baccata]|uniref:Plastocyanin-like domain-containing protein n=1 Tax=Malus baccata TaxID=106549 RepID=A0A540LWP7_MALBA|nr:hypothetical protein C1H46_023646 [Malus baccata]
MSIHWHGLKQYRNGWADGPAYVTQCPIQTGSSYTHDFNVTGQRGTLWWHAHILWLRATVYGALVIMPKQGTPFPFAQPYRETKIILGEWWNVDVETFVNKANSLGLPPNSSDAHTINGKPGPLFPCSEKRKQTPSSVLFLLSKTTPRIEARNLNSKLLVMDHPLKTLTMSIRRIEA